MVLIDRLRRVPRSPALRDHVAAAILDTAARVLAERREAASLTDIAEAAGVARSTLYRYFPSREALLAALAETAASEIQVRLEESQLDTLPVADALARVTRGLIATGGKYIALAYLWPKPADAEEQRVAFPLQSLIRRGVADGTLRGDIPAETLFASYADLLEGAMTRAARTHAGVEDASAAVVSLFLEGAKASRG